MPDVVSQSAWNSVWKTQLHGVYSHLARRILRTKEKIQLFAARGVRFEPGSRVLEAGCGDGLVLLNLVRMYGLQGTALDFSDEALAKAKEFQRVEGVPFELHLADTQDTRLPAGHFDSVLSLGVIEHLPVPEAAVVELHRVLRPGGRLILMTPNRRSSGHWDRRLREKLGTWNLGPQVEFTPAELADMGVRAGFSVEQSFVAHRRYSREEGLALKIVTLLDNCLRHVVPGWGFYSYAILVKSHV